MQKTTRQDIWQSPCGCWHVGTPRRTPWFYKPEWYWGRWSPVWMGGDEYCRYTLVIGWNVTGQIIIPLWYCRDKDCVCCGDEWFSGCTPWSPEVRDALQMTRDAKDILAREWDDLLTEVEQDTEL